MKKRNSFNKLVVFSSLVYIVGIVIFITGFLPVKKRFEGYASPHDITSIREDTSRDQTNLQIMKIVFIVIDGLRADFIPSVMKNRFKAVTMPFVEELISNGSAMTFVSKAHNPTVTMPRIKAMMSGTIPAFMDVIMNLDATNLKEDSLLYQSHHAKRKIIFYGDETWVNLFGNYLHSYEGTTSFFVSDFIEVDHNVTRHLDRVLKQPEWDMLILHYLGLDHIGHLAGLSSPLIRPKLKEMDDVVKKIHRALNRERHLIVITGDHGMTPSGSHGGASSGETLTPLIFMSEQPGRSSEVQHVMQVDIASTLSVLMNLPIPKNNIGKLIPSVLEREGLSKENILNAAFLNAHQVANVLKTNEVFNMEDLLKSVVDTHQTWLQSKDDALYDSLKKRYLHVIEEMRVKLEDSVSGFDIYFMFLGFLTTFAALLSVSRISSAKGISVLEDEMLYTKLMVLVPSVIVSSGIQFVVCIETSHSLCSTVWLWPVPVLLLSYFLYHIIQCSYLLPSTLSGQTITLSVELFVIAGSLFHVISLGSSSFVEEEHQTWYFLSTSLIILLFFKNVHHIIKSFDLTLEMGFLQRNKPGNFSIYRRSLVIKMGYCFGFLILARICRSWNQTGNKWAHLPDIGDYLREKNPSLITVITVISLFSLFGLLRTHRTVQQCCMILSTLGTMAYHFEAVKMSGVSINKHLIAWVVYLAITVHLLECIYHSFKRASQRCSRIQICEIFFSGLCTTWIMLVLLLCRTHNVPLFLFVVLQERLLRNLVWHEPMSFFVRTSAYLWISMCTFFYQGNSNMISTLDVSSGYVGLFSYLPVIVGFLMLCNTYSGVVYILLQYVTQLCHSLATGSTTMETSNISSILCIRFSSTTMYLAVVILLRHHLFIWTVFAPKLLYEGAHSLIFTSFVLVIIVLMKITNRGSS